MTLYSLSLRAKRIVIASEAKQSYIDVMFSFYFSQEVDIKLCPIDWTVFVWLFHEFKTYKIFWYWLGVYYSK